MTKSVRKTASRTTTSLKSAASRKTASLKAASRTTSTRKTASLKTAPLPAAARKTAARKTVPAKAATATPTPSSRGLAIGQLAPTFAVPDQDGNIRLLRDFAGRWLVLYFYPKDDTPGCSVEACDFTSGLDAFRDLDATVVGVSADSPESHRKFIAKYNLKFPLLADTSRTMIQAYGAWGEKTLYGRTSMGIIRSTVIIDPQGRVAHHYPKVRAEGHAADVRARLAELRA